MIEIKDIKKSFKDKVVLNGVNIVLEEGKVYGLVGANGAGKTTLLNIIARVLSLDSGSIVVNGIEIKYANDLKGRIGYIIDIPAMHEYMTAYEYLEFIASPLKISKEEFKSIADKALSQVGLKDVENKRIKSFSRGMKQRMGIAAGLLSNPDIILMDEPCSALDPIGRHDVLNIIEELKRENKTIILSTHILTDIERVCDKVGFLVNGKIREEGKLHDILNKHSQNIFKVYTDEQNFNKIIDKAKTSEYFVSCNIVDGVLEIEFLKDGKKKMFKTIASLNIDINGIVLKEPSIEAIFMSLNKEV